MNRLPPRRTLDAMSENARWAVLDLFACNLRDEIDAFKDGLVISYNGVPIARHLANTRKRLARVYRTAKDYGHYVGQPS